MFNLHSDIICSHEMIATDCADPEREILSRLRDYEYVGDCCSSYVDPNRAGCPGKKVWIDRPEKECRKGIERALKSQLTDEIWGIILRQAQCWVRENDPFIIGFEELFTLEGARRLWQYCVDCEFPEKKVEHLLGLRVQKTTLLDYDLRAIRAKIN